MLSGVSGVGKSSITSELLPDTYIKIAEISSANEEGRHTTRTSRLYHLPNNGQLIDTPGVRGFNPLLDPTQPISAGFREINQHSADCRFANCKHINEPKCAVIDAVKNEKVTAEFQRICDGYNPEFSHIEQIKKFKLLTAQWEPMKGDGSDAELTPTLKLKRRVIRDKHQSDIANIYGA